MIFTNNTYKEFVLDDLKNHEGLYHPIKSPILFRIRPWKIGTTKLHPNPNDEFAMNDIGPNWNIIGDYEKSVFFHYKRKDDLFDDPIIAVRLYKAGYMILNGHHRWMACINMRIPKVPVKIVNITQEDDVYKVINKSKRDRCVTIDFDEVLFSDDFQEETKDIPFPLNLIYKKNIRDNAALLVREFQHQGYDVWVYTGSYLSEQYIRGLFSINNCHVDGVVNGINGKKNHNKLRDIFREKYNTILHVDNASLTFVNPQTKKYEIIDINVSSEEWASAVATKANEFDFTILNN